MVFSSGEGRTALGEHRHRALTSDPWNGTENLHGAVLAKRRIVLADFFQKLLDALCRYAFLGNLSGLPAASAPVGRDAKDLPIGLQLVGDAWDEATVLAALAQLERTGAARVLRPRVSVKVL